MHARISSSAPRSAAVTGDCRPSSRHEPRLAEKRPHETRRFFRRARDERAIGVKSTEEELPRNTRNTRKKVSALGFRVSVCSVGNIWTDQPIFFVDFEGSRAKRHPGVRIAEVHHGKIASRHTRLCRATGRGRRRMRSARVERSDAHRARAICRRTGNSLPACVSAAHSLHTRGVEKRAPEIRLALSAQLARFLRGPANASSIGARGTTRRVSTAALPTFPSGKLEALVAACGLQGELDALAPRTVRPAPPFPRGALRCARGALLLAVVARDPVLAYLSTMQLSRSATLDGEKRDALQQRELF